MRKNECILCRMCERTRPRGGVSGENATLRSIEIVKALAAGATRYRVYVASIPRQQS